MSKGNTDRLIVSRAAYSITIFLPVFVFVHYLFIFIGYTVIDCEYEKINIIGE